MFCAVDKVSLFMINCMRFVFVLISVTSMKDIFDTIPVWTETTPAREMTVAEIEKELGHGVKVVGEDGREWEF